MKILKITKSIKIFKVNNKTVSFELKEGDLYLQNELQISNFGIFCQQINIPQKSFSTYHEVHELLNDFSNRNKTVFIHRTGGAGDILALSSVCKWLHEHNFKVVFITLKRYKPLFDWFQTPVTFLNYEDRLPFKAKDFDFGILQYEGLIERSKTNWFELFFKPVSNVCMLKYGRPQLKVKRSIRFKLKSNSILLCLKATSKIRSIDFEPVYFALKNLISKDTIIYVHEENLSQKDKDFLLGMFDKRIKILPKSNLNKFLFDCYDAGLVISTDTGALHFREGINKPCLGLYNSFYSKCRTKYYKIIKTLDIKSQCQDQPCYIHTQTPNEDCKHLNYCLDHKWNKTIHIQLTEFFTKNL